MISLKQFITGFLLCFCCLLGFSQKQTFTDSAYLLCNKFQYLKAIELVNSLENPDNDLLLLKANAYKNLYKYPEAIAVYNQI